jgi:hypothetical protein
MSSQLNRDREKQETREASLFDLFFRDQSGHIVIAQAPNPPIVVGVAAALLQFLWTPGPIQTSLKLIAFGTLFTWAWMELFKGVNYFRRSLGLIGLMGLLWLGLQFYGV